MMLHPNPLEPHVTTPKNQHHTLILLEQFHESTLRWSKADILNFIVQTEPTNLIPLTQSYNP